MLSETRTSYCVRSIYSLLSSFALRAALSCLLAPINMCPQNFSLGYFSIKNRSHYSEAFLTISRLFPSLSMKRLVVPDTSTFRMCQFGSSWLLLMSSKVLIRVITPPGQSTWRITGAFVDQHDYCRYYFLFDERRSCLLNACFICFIWVYAFGYPVSRIFAVADRFDIYSVQN